MKNQTVLKSGVALFAALFLLTNHLPAQIKGSVLGVNIVKQTTEKGFIDKKSVFHHSALDSLLTHDDYVMLISSYEGCGPCEFLRTSDVFDRYPISPYYVDKNLCGENLIVPYMFNVSAFPTCFYFDKSGEIVAVTCGTRDMYEKIDKIVNDRERYCDEAIKGLEPERLLAFYNASYKASAAFLSGNMENVFHYAAQSMEAYPNLYNRYLLYKYYTAVEDREKAGTYKSLALDNATGLDRRIYKALIDEMTGE